MQIVEFICTIIVIAVLAAAVYLHVTAPECKHPQNHAIQIGRTTLIVTTCKR